jgi:peptidoglycan/xylan/chitin deacetylase (PgdA/CDA1 family)
MVGSRFSVCLTFDFDAMSPWIGTVKSRNPSTISRGELCAVFLPRILELLARHKVIATFFTPGHTALAYPELMRRIHGEGHEIGHHGWVHENPADFDEAGERRILERGLEALHGACDVVPKGYRSPAWDVSTHTIGLLREFEFLYDSSFMGNDYSPYYLREGDKWSTDEPYVFGHETDLVEIPVAWHLDDFPNFEFVPGFPAALNAPSAVEEMWLGDFEWGYANKLGGVLDITMHPQVIGRGHRLLMLDRFIRTIKGHDDVAFETMTAVAARWKAQNPSPAVPTRTLPAKPKLEEHHREV